MKHDVIFSRYANDAFLNADKIQELAPAVYTETKNPERSNRYAHINTAQAITILADHGYQVTQAAQVRNRTQAATLYGQHMIALSNPDIAPGDGEGRPEIVLYNSGDGKSALRMFAGFYRFICSNGIVAGNGFEVKAAHYQTTAGKFEEMIKTAGERLPVMYDNVTRLKAFEVPYQAEIRLAEQAMKLRWNEYPAPIMQSDIKPGTYAAGSTAVGLLKIKRSEDLQPNAWTIFNKIQEGLIRGGPEVISVTKNNPGGSYRKSKALGSVASSLKVNRNLWDMFDLENLEQILEKVAA